MAAGRGALHGAAFVTLLALATLTLLELGAAGLLLFAPGFPSRSEIQRSLVAPAAETRARLPAAGEETPEPGAQGNALHPYLGYVRRPNPGGGNTVNRRAVALPVNEYGFFGPPPQLDGAAGTASVAITGGSLALELFLYGRETLAAELRSAGVFGDRQIEIVSLALGGWKQPQQLLTLNYLLALGASLDAVVNLDGFNELALSFENAERLDVSPAYPTRWRTLAAQGLDLETAALVGRIVELRERRERLRARASGPPLRHSSLVLAAWHALARRLEAAEGALEGELAESLVRGERGGAQARGPSFRYASPHALHVDSAGLWSRASLQMWRLCQANRIAYFHFLQPNQHVPGAKVLTARESRLARGGAHFRAAIEVGHPLLVAAGEHLRRRGVPFVDLSAIFREERGEIYRDDCCHLNDGGYEMLAQRIAREMAARAGAEPGG